MTTVRTSNYPVAAPPAEQIAQRTDGQFDQLRHFLDRAAAGEIDLDGGQPQANAGDGKLPAAWYAAPPEAPHTLLLQRTQLRPETLAGLLGLAAGLVVLVPLALWWQNTFTSNNAQTAVTSQSFTSAYPADIRPLASSAASGEGRIEVVSVKSISVTKPAEDDTVTDARAKLAEGQILAARELLSKAVAARDPEGLFLLAETYDPNLLAAHQARGVGADAERARALYTSARSLGHARAAARLEALR
jgi:hypothetical protein